MTNGDEFVKRSSSDSDSYYTKALQRVIFHMKLTLCIGDVQLFDKVVRDIWEMKTLDVH